MGKNRRWAEKTFWMDPKHLLFTQPDIESTFTDPELPSVEETISLIRHGLLDPKVLGPLHVFMDVNRRMWCDGNRRLFALRQAGVRSIDCVCHGHRIPKTCLRKKLSDFAFIPQIRGESSSVRIPPPSPTYQLQKEPEHSLLNSQPYRSHEDELGVRFNQLHIKPTSTGPKYPNQRESASSKQWGESDQPYVPSNLDFCEYWNTKRRFYAHREAEDDSAPVGFYGKYWGNMNAVQSKPNDTTYMLRISDGGSGVRNPPPPTSGRTGYQMEKGYSLMGSVSAGYSSKGELRNRHAYHGMEVKNKYPVPYEYQVLPEGEDDDEEDDGYTGMKRLFDDCSINSDKEYGNGYPFHEYEDVGNMKGKVYRLPFEDDGKIDDYFIPTNFSEDDFKFNMKGKVYRLPFEDEGKIDDYFIPTNFSGDDFNF